MGSYGRLLVVTGQWGAGWLMLVGPKEPKDRAPACSPTPTDEAREEKRGGRDLGEQAEEVGLLGSRERGVALRRPQAQHLLYHEGRRTYQGHRGC